MEGESGDESWRQVYVFGPSSFNMTTICRRRVSLLRVACVVSALGVRILTYPSVFRLGPKPCTIERNTLVGVPSLPATLTSLPPNISKSSKFCLLGVQSYPSRS